MKKQTWYIVIGIIVLAFIGSFFIAGNAGEKNNEGIETLPLRAKGPADAPVTLVEYSDFECPACAAFFPVLKQLETEFSNDLRIVYRHFPLPIHGNADLAARASEAAGVQGKFWEMHDLLFQGQRQWAGSPSARAVFEGYAEQLELDLNQFKSNINAPLIKDRVAADQQEGRSVPVSGTPTFVLNGEKIQNPNSLEAFRALIQEALDATTSSEQNSQE